MIEPLLGELKPIPGLDFVFGSGIVEPHALVCEDKIGTEKRAREQNCNNAFHCWVVPSVRKYEEHCGSFKYQHEANPLIYAAAVRASKECPPWNPWPFANLAGCGLRFIKALSSPKRPAGNEEKRSDYRLYSIKGATFGRP